MKTLEAKIYKNMTANGNKSDLSYVNKLLDQYNNTYFFSIGRKPINTDYSVLTLFRIGIFWAAHEWGAPSTLPKEDPKNK